MASGIGCQLHNKLQPPSEHRPEQRTEPEFRGVGERQAGVSDSPIQASSQKNKLGPSGNAGRHRDSGRSEFRVHAE